MRISDVTKDADALDPKNRSAITNLIDTKVESDMEKAFMLMRNEFSSLKAELVNMETRFDSQFKNVDSQFKHVDSQFKHVESKFSTVYWVVGLTVTLSTALLAIIISLKK